jgi:hypothetical protein
VASVIIHHKNHYHYRDLNLWFRSLDLMPLVQIEDLRYSRVSQLEEVVEALLSDHDDGQLDAQLGKAAGGVADIALKLEEL